MTENAPLTADQIAEILAFAPADEVTTSVAFERTRPAPVKTAAEIQWQYEADLDAIARRNNARR